MEAGLAVAALDEYGRWIGGLAPWTHFVTLTHRPPEDDRSRTWRRIGVARHRRMVREWFYEDVRPLDRSARWWSEMEFHDSGQPHEHGMLAVAETAPVLSMRQAWWERAGFAKWRDVDDAAGAAAYVSKYAQKATSREPLIWGFGLLRAPSFAQTFAAAQRGHREARERPTLTERGPTRPSSPGRR